MEFSGIIDPHERQRYLWQQNKFFVSGTLFHQGYTRENPDPEHLTTSVDDI
jgi:hypothetical protein